MPENRTKKVFHESIDSVYYLIDEENGAGPYIQKTLKSVNPAPEELEMLENEISFADLPHVDGLARVLGPGHDDFSVNLEYIEGETLLQRVKKNPTLPERLKLAASIAASLAKVHSAGLIYRNFAPNHIIVTNENKPVFIDLSLATMVTGKVKASASSGILADPLYISPELTGRINRVVDHRSDLYSFGALLYWLFAGIPPFQGMDLLETVHAHIALETAPLIEKNPDIPKQVSDIVARLLAKNPDLRYQSAYGAMHDLELCCVQLEATGSISDFVPGLNDFSGHLMLAHKIYGRDAEKQLLFDAFENAVEGHKQLTTVSGYSGMGKTAVIEELYEPVLRSKSLFISGKYDKYQHDVPYFGFSEAFTEFVEYVISQDEETIESWKTRVHEACYPIGKVLINICPQLEVLVGDHPELPDLNGAEEQNRFNYALIMFMKTIASPNHPLVLFLDDVQWCDRPSLQLIKLLMIENDLKNLLILCSYRENEVNEFHPVAEMLKELDATGCLLQEIKLGQMQPAAIEDMLRDILQTKQSDIPELAEIVFHKSQGNALFINQFLKSISEDGLLHFDFSLHTWLWDKENIIKRNLSGDIEELLGSLVDKLPLNARQMLTYASAIGSYFDIPTLHKLTDLKDAEIKKILQPALISGLILENGSELLFAHDRILHYFYNQLAEDVKENFHLQIGRIRLAESKKIDNPDNIFIIIYHWIKAKKLLTDEKEIITFIQLNLLAGKKARASAAYSEALQYFMTALEMQPANPWSHNYGMMLELTSEAAAAAYMAGEHSKCDEFVQQVEIHAKDVLDTVNAGLVKIQSNVARNQPIQAIDYGYALLKKLGENLPEKPGQVNVVWGLLRTGIQLRGKSQNNVLNLPANTDKRARAAMNVMFHMLSPGYFVMPNLIPVVIFRLIKLTLKYGLDSKSPYVFLGYGYILSAFMGQIKRGTDFADLALVLHEKLDTKPLSASIYTVYYDLVKHWTMPLADTLEPLLKGFRLGMETGDAEFTSYLAFDYVYHGFYSGKNLHELSKSSTGLLNQILSFNQPLTNSRINVFQQSIADLINMPMHPGVLMGDYFNEETHGFADDSQNGIFFHNLYMQKLFLAVVYRDKENAWKYAEKARKYIQNIQGSPFIPLFYFYESMAAADMAEIRPARKRELSKVIFKNIRRFKKYVVHSPENFADKLKLMEATYYRISKNQEKGQGAFFAALRQARQSQVMLDEAITWEMSGEFYLEQGQDQVAAFYLQNAYHAYHHWGAFGKCKQLSEKYHSLNLTADKHLEHKAGGDGQNLDLATVVKAYNVLSGEIILSELLEKMMHIMVENAGAQRGVLIRDINGERSIMALLNKGDAHAEILLNEPFTHSEKVSRSVVNYTANSDNYVVIDNAVKTRPHNTDPYIIRNNVLSVICLPVKQKGKLFGYLYLENNLVPGVFTPARISLLNILASQAAVSLENAELYDNLTSLNTQMKQEISEKELAQQALLENERRLEEYNATLEQKVEERTQEIKKQKDELEVEKHKSDTLLLNILPQETAEELKREGKAVPRRFDKVTVLFTDFVEFSRISENVSADVLVNEIHYYFSAFDEIIAKYGLEKIKTIGDAYMCAAGIPREHPDGAISSVKAAMEIEAFVAKAAAEREANGGIPFKIRLGLHSGPVVAGIVGTRKFAYDIWGDTVNVASRMESNSVPGKINITAETYELVKDVFECSYRGEINVKNKGEIGMYFVEGEKSKSQPGPTN